MGVRDWRARKTYGPGSGVARQRKLDLTGYERKP